MIIFDNHEILSIHKWHHAITYVYKGTRLVWQSVRSCFGRGIWIPDKPWLGNDKWKNTN